MNDEAHFLAALRANPNDVEAVQVFADWLDERGDPRAEFLRFALSLEKSHGRESLLEAVFRSEWTSLIKLLCLPQP